MASTSSQPWSISFLREKGVEGAVLITDATSATGMPDGTYRLGNFEVEVRNGQCTSHGKLAGSVLTLDRAIRNVMDFAGWTLQNAVRLATYNPARVLGLEKRKGVIANGADADFVILGTQGEVQKHNHRRSRYLIVEVVCGTCVTGFCHFSSIGIDGFCQCDKCRYRTCF